jgi:hypothetical protein
MVELAGADGGDDCGGAAERATGRERKVERDIEGAARQRRGYRGEKESGELGSGPVGASV